MARINVQFGVTQRTSAAGNDYYLIEMRTTDKNGQYRELPDVKLTPFTARLLLEHLPEFCNAIQEGERQKAQGGGAPQSNPLAAEAVVAPTEASAHQFASAPASNSPTQEDTPF